MTDPQSAGEKSPIELWGETLNANRTEACAHHKVHFSMNIFC